jgi:protein CpxP
MTNYPALAAIALFALAGPVAAQPGPPHGMPSEADMKARMAEHMAQMDKDMHTILRLRPDQEGAWRAFRDAMHPPDGPDRMVAAPKPGQTTPQRLEAMDKMAAEHQARHAKMQGALRAFYAALSSEQQAVFDALHRMHGPGGHGGGPRGMMHGPGAPGGDAMFQRHVIIDGGGPPHD